MVDEYDTKSFCNETCSESEIIRNKYELKTELKEKLLQLPDVLSFIELLQKYIEKQKKKLRKLKTKLKTLKKYNDASTQTCNNQNNIVEPNDEHSVESKSIAEDIKEAAEIALQNSGFVYEETSGMYYDYNTGYYYNAEYGLYYDGNSGTYLTYNQNTKTYDFHSQVASNEQRSVHDKIAKSHKKRKRKNGANEKDSKRVRNFEHKQSPTGQEVEEGECSLSSDSSEDDNNSDTSDLCKRWPPCMRIIIESSSVPKLKVGSLHIVTCNGGTIGREGNHSLLIPDINISKHHLKIEFEKERNSYTAIDLGSRNGTILNGKRMSTSKQESDPMLVTHGSKIQIGSTTLLCHIHDGNQTCGHCEPGLIQNSDEHQNTKKVPTISESHKNELKKLRKKFGVSNYEADPKLATGYTDRAQKRRDTVGSQNPHEKTQIASVDESISSENKGFKMLSKMGWKEGQSLGKDGEGLKEPIQVLSNKGTSGMGCSETNILSKQTTAINDDKKKIWMKTQERFEKLPIVASFSDESN